MKKYQTLQISTGAQSGNIKPITSLNPDAMEFLLPVKDPDPEEYINPQPTNIVNNPITQASFGKIALWGGVLLGLGWLWNKNKK